MQKHNKIKNWVIDFNLRPANEKKNK